MKTMTCKQLGGVCDKQFHAETLKDLGGFKKRSSYVQKDVELSKFLQANHF
ncbi:hypothetical protein ACFL1A_02275 [Patescibacteria group bacterium]